MRPLLLLVYVLFYNTTCIGQNPCKIGILVQEYSKDTIFVGAFKNGERSIIDTLVKTKNGDFYLNRNQPLDQGMYFIQLLPDKRYFEFLVDADQEFYLSTNYTKLYENLSVKGSVENELFFQCLRLVNNRRKEADELASKIKMLRMRDPKESTNLQNKLKLLNNQVIQEQLYALRENKNTIVYKYILSTKEPEVPEFDSRDPQQVKDAEFYFKTHYLENIDFNDPRTSNAPYAYNQILTLLNNNVTNADSLIKAIDIVMLPILGIKQNGKSYFEYILKILSSERPLTLENGFVHLINSYVAKNKLTFLSQAEIENLVKIANEITKLLVGNTAPDFSLFDQYGKLTKLSDCDSTLIVLYFGKPGCQNCSEAIQGLIDFHEVYQYKKVGVFGICTEQNNSADKCNRFANANLLKFPFLSDGKKIKSVIEAYHIRQEPVIFLLDNNKKIITKNIHFQELYKSVNQKLELSKN